MNLQRILNILRFLVAWPIYCALLYPYLIIKALWSPDKEEWHKKPMYVRLPLCVLRAILVALYFPLLAILGWFIITVDIAKGKIGEDEEEDKEDEWLIAKILNSVFKAALGKQKN